MVANWLKEHLINIKMKIGQCTRLAGGMDIMISICQYNITYH